MSEMRIPLAIDFVVGRRMKYRDKTVIYCGRSSTGAFVFEQGFHDFVSLWPFQLRVKDTPIHPPFDEAKWLQDKQDAADKAWVKKIHATEDAINRAVAASRQWWKPSNGRA